MTLESLLDEARTAPAGRRIEWRDRLAEHGQAAMDAVAGWLADPVLAAFAIRVIVRVGSNGDPARATEILRSARSRVPDRAKGDVAWALERLKTVARPERPPSTETARPAPRLLIREPAHLSLRVRRGGR